MRDQLEIPVALQAAQRWVRELTNSEISTYIREVYAVGDYLDNKILIPYRAKYALKAQQAPNERPFQHTFYWAAFTIYGV